MSKISCQSIIRTDTNSQPKKRPEPQTVYHYLYLPEYGSDSSTRQVTSHSFKNQIISNQSTAYGGHRNVTSVRAMTDEYGNRDPNTIILIKGLRTPADEDGNVDSNGNTIVRDLLRMYYEDYEITSLHPITKATIGSLTGSLHYVDIGDSTATTTPFQTFPINNATGIWKDYKNGYIKWFYHNNTPLFRRKLIVYPE